MESIKYKYKYNINFLFKIHIKKYIKYIIIIRAYVD